MRLLAEAGEPLFKVDAELADDDDDDDDDGSEDDAAEAAAAVVPRRGERAVAPTATKPNTGIPIKVNIATSVTMSTMSKICLLSSFESPLLLRVESKLDR